VGELLVACDHAIGVRRPAQAHPRDPRAILTPFVDRDARVEVLWALARALCGSSAHYDRLWDARSALQDVPVTIVWGLADSAFRPNQLARWREAVPHATVVEIPTAGHWPHEEAPEIVGPAIAQALG
jgi:haloalkane dehalogenase